MAANCSRCCAAPPDPPCTRGSVTPTNCAHLPLLTIPCRRLCCELSAWTWAQPPSLQSPGRVSAVSRPHSLPELKRPLLHTCLSALHPCCTLRLPRQLAAHLHGASAKRLCKCFGVMGGGKGSMAQLEVLKAKNWFLLRLLTSWALWAVRCEQADKSKTNRDGEAAKTEQGCAVGGEWFCADEG